MSESTESTPEPGSEEEARQYVEQVRSAPAEQVLAGILSSQLEAAQFKLGRKDARLFIDLCAETLERVRPYVSADMAQQVVQMLDRLRLAQVEGESEIAGRPEPNDLDTVPTLADAPPEGSSSPPSPAASKLWIPGR